MGSLRRLLPALLLPLAAIVACGSDDDEGITSAQFAAEYCALYRPCCQAAGLPGNAQQGCQTLFGLIPIADRAAAQLCLDEWKEKAKAANFCKLEDEPQSEACARAFPQGDPVSGSTPPGGACEFDSDCARSSRGDVSCHYSSGKSACLVAVPANAGESCAATKQGNATYFTGDTSGPEIGICARESGLYCAQGTCKGVVPNGAPCTDDAGCEAGFCASGVCTAPGPAGSSCAVSPSACDEQSYCEFTDQTCHARGPVGAPCETFQQCLSGVCDGTKCGEFNPGGFGLLLFCS